MKQHYENIISKAQDSISHYNRRIDDLVAAINLGKDKGVNNQLKQDIKELRDKVKEEKDKIKDAQKELRKL